MYSRFYLPRSLYKILKNRFALFHKVAFSQMFFSSQILVSRKVLQTRKFSDSEVFTAVSQLPETQNILGCGRFNKALGNLCLTFLTCYKVFLKCSLQSIGWTFPTTKACADHSVPFPLTNGECVERSRVGSISFFYHC